MQMGAAVNSDFELLSQYRAGSEAAFSELVGRHVDWIYSAARRRVGDTHMAEDVVQAVFMALANNRRLREGMVMSGWLFGVMRYTSAKAIRAEARRRRHEMAAGEARRDAGEINDKAWEEFAPALEAAVARLGRRDREAILLRFYQRLSFGEVGEALGISDEGARKRIARAIAKLRRYFPAKGAAVSEAALASTMFLNVTRHARAGLGASISAGLGGSSGESALLRSWLRKVRLRLVLRAVVLIAAASAIAGIVFVRSTTSAPAQRGGAADGAATQPVNGPDSSTYATALTFDQIIAGVKASEHQFQNVHIKDFETTVEELPQGQTKWIASKVRYAGSAWYDAEPGGKERIYVTDEILPWEQGTAPWAESMADMSWDGKEGRYLHLADGTPGKLGRMRSAILSGDVPAGLDTYWRDWTGVGYTLQYWVEIQEVAVPHKPRRLFSDNLTAVAKVHKSPEIVGQRVNGFDTVRLRFGNSMAAISYWFDPSRGFALVKQEDVSHLPKHSSTEGMEVREFKRCDGGIWFPVRASLVKEDIGHFGSYLRFNYRAGDVTVNDPKFDDGIFRAQIPVGWVVWDRRTPSEDGYVVMGDGTKMELHRGSAMPRMKAGVATRPDGEAPAITREPRAAW
jgi:RNA polymerase sigma factor (sigma-70 family)